MNKILKEIAAFFIFLIMLLNVAYYHRDSNTFLMTKTLFETFDEVDSYGIDLAAVRFCFISILNIIQVKQSSIKLIDCSSQLSLMFPAKVEKKEYTRKKNHNESKFCFPGLRWRQFVDVGTRDPSARSLWNRMVQWEESSGRIYRQYGRLSRWGSAD
jgi:hypothetical protein